MLNPPYSSITEEQKEQLLLAKGLDPREYYFDPLTSSAYRKQPKVESSEPATQTENVTQETQKAAREITRLDAIGAALKASIVPTLSGGGGAGLGMRIGAAGGPAGSAIGGLVGGVGGALLGSLGQNKAGLIAPETMETLKQGREQFPITTTLAEMAPNVLLGNPLKAISQLPKLGGAIKNVARGALLSPGQKAAGINALANVGIGTGLEAGQQVLTEGEIDPLRLALVGGAGGLLFNEPTKLGRMLGFQPTGEANFPKAKEGRKTTVRGYLPEQSSAIDQGEVFYGDEKGQIAKGAMPLEVPPAPERVRKPNFVLERAAKLRREKDFFKAKEELANEEVRTVQLEAERQRQINNARQAEMDEKTTTGRWLQEEMTRGQIPQKDRFPQPKETYSRANEGQPPADPSIISQQEKTLLKQRGQNIVEEPDLKRGGSSILGEFIPKNREVRISQSKAAVTTRPHEGAHAMLQDLKNSPLSRDKKLYRKALEVGKEIHKKGNLSPNDIESIKGLKSADDIAEELFVRKAAVEDYKRLVSRPNKSKGTLGEFWQDVAANVKYKLGTADNKAVIRHLNSRYNFDAAYGTRTDVLPTAKGGKPAAAETPKKQTAPEDMPPELNEVLSASGLDMFELPKKWGVKGQTYKSDELAGKLPNTPEVRSMLDSMAAKGDSEFRSYILALKDKKMSDADMQTLSGLAMKGQFFREISQKLEGEGKQSRAADDIVGEMENKLRDSAFNKAKSTVKAHKEAREKAEFESQREGEKVEPEYTQDLKEADEEYNLKREELDAFTFPDKSRQSSAEDDLTPQARGKAQLGFEKQTIDPDINEIITKVNNGEKLTDKEVSIAERIEFPPGTNPKTPAAEFLAAKNEWQEKIYGNDPEAAARVRAKLANPPPEEDIKSSAAGEDLENPAPKKFGFFKTMESAVDKVRRVGGEIGNEVADAAERFFTRKDRYEGKFRNTLHYDVNKLELDSKELSNVYNYLRANYRGEGDAPALSAKEEAAHDRIMETWDSIREEQNKLGLKGTTQERRTSKSFVPDILSDESIYTFTRQAGSQKVKEMQQEWIDYIVKQSDGATSLDQVTKDIKEYVRSLNENRILGVDYNALRRAQFYGIPESLRETNLQKLIMKYGRRSAHELAYWGELQSNPRIAAALSLPKRSGGLTEVEGVESISSNPAVQNLMKFVTSDFSYIANPRINAISRAVTNLLLGGATGIRNTVQLPSLFAPYLETTADVTATFKALGNIAEARRKSLEYGSRSGTMDFDRWQVLDSPDKVTQFFNRFAEAARKYQGRDLLEQTDRILTFAIGKEIAKNKVIEALNGREASLQWLKKFGALEKVTQENLNNLDLDQIAANFTTRVQGSYDARGLAAGVFDSPFAPFMALSRWSIEKSNVLYKDVILPAHKGNFKPLIVYTLGSMLTGAAIKELNEAMSGKKEYSPSLAEATAADKKDFQIASVINLMQMGAYMGLMGDLLKASSDLIIQKDLPRNPLTFPAMTMAEDMVYTLADMRKAIEDGIDPIEAFTRFGWETMRQSTQNLRLLDSRVLNAEDTERSNKYRDLRVFKKLEDNDLPFAAGQFRRGRISEHKPEKEFKRETDLGKAAAMVPKLIAKAIDEAKGDPYKLQKAFTALKINSYQTAPSPEENPIEFAKFVDFLAKTQGKEKAAETIADYFQRTAINKAKSQMLP